MIPILTINGKDFILDTERMVLIPAISGGIFILDVSTLAGLDFNYVENTVNDRGRSISVQWDQSGLNQDMELFGYSIRFYPAEEEAKEQV